MPTPKTGNILDDEKSKFVNNSSGQNSVSTVSEISNVSAISGGFTDFDFSNVSTTANAEASITFAANVRGFYMKVRGHTSSMLIAKNTGDIALNNYVEVDRGNQYTLLNVELGGKTLYFQTAVDATVEFTLLF